MIIDAIKLCKNIPVKPLNISFKRNSYGTDNSSNTDLLEDALIGLAISGRSRVARKSKLTEELKKIVKRQR